MTEREDDLKVSAMVSANFDSLSVGLFESSKGFMIMVDEME